MNLSNILKFLIPLLIQGVAIAEKEYKDTPDSGSAKKQLVTDIANTAINTIQTVATGGAKDTWNILALPVSNMIDATATLLFPKRK